MRHTTAMKTRLLASVTLVLASMLPAAAQNNRPAAKPLRQDAQRAGQPAARVANARQAPPIAPPGFPLSAADQQQLDQVLLAWQQQSTATKTLHCQFKRWHYDMSGAPAGVPASKSQGVIKYAKPDKGLFQVEQKVFYGGLVEGKPKFAAKEGQYGEHWVCNGRQVIEFDQSEKKCTIQNLPPSMQGAGIIESPLPFVFNSDAEKIKQRYWVRQVQTPNDGLIVIEAWPKRQRDRAEYKLVQIALKKDTFLPAALVLYAPNFDAAKAQNMDQYEFFEVKRNSFVQGWQMFVKNFIPQKPPADWQLVQENFGGEQ